MSIAIVSIFLPHPLDAQDSFRWDLVNALSRNNYGEVEHIIKNNIESLSGQEKRMIMSFTLTYSRGDTVLNVLNLLSGYGVPVTARDLYTALNMNQSDAVINHLLQNGALTNSSSPVNGEILLLAMYKKRFDFAKQFIESGADVNYSYPLSRSYSDGMTPLLYASKYNEKDLVKLLLEKGANINARSREGETALSIAQVNGNTEIYDYLMERGASVFPPSSVQTALPADSLNPGGSAVNSGIAGLLNNRQSGFQRGTYRLSGGDLNIRFIGTETAGTVSYTINGRASNGAYMINGSTLTVVMEERTFIYKIDSPAFFSGNGEMWIRTGE